MSKRIVLTGGGTGGHITPLLAVAYQLKLKDPDCYVIYIGERNAKYASFMADNNDFDEFHSIFAGKFRRYHGESLVRRIFSLKTNLLNLRDLIYFGIGTIQSLILLKRLKPDMILLKGGFVGVPVGLAAAFWKKKFITHDSDAMPGLANRLVSRWALYHATGMPPEYYSYPKNSIRYVGVLVGSQYEKVNNEIQKQYKKQLNLPEESQIITITGGSGGAAAINQAVRAVIDDILEANDKLYVFHQVGIGKGDIYAGYSHERLKVFELLSPMHIYTGASDLVVTRAGANTLAELGVQGRACIVIPNPLLTGGHQLKNAELWHQEQAAIVLDEKETINNPETLKVHIQTLLNDENLRLQVGEKLNKLTVSDAAAALASVILESSDNDVQTK